VGRERDCRPSGVEDVQGDRSWLQRIRMLQDTFLEHVRKHDVPVTVFLANGIRLQGTVAGFDSYALLLVRDRHSQLIYKHAISTIVLRSPVR
jgi:host factor-I protein